ncbi:MAG TPA: HEAT repeat domain-containing protein [Gaiellales bacterium]
MAAPLEVALALIAIGVMYSLLLWARRVHAQASQRRHAEARVRLEPFAHALLEGEPAGTAARRDEHALTEILSELAPALTGESRDAIAGHFEASGAVARVSRKLADPRAHRRAEHAALLGDMCSSLAEVPLLQALNDRDPDVRLAAARSLGRLKPRTAAGPLLFALVQGLVPRAVAANALLSIGAAALPGIRNLLADDQPAARANAVELLGRLGNPRDSESLRERLGDDAPLVRRRACEALARLGADDAGDALEELLSDAVADVRMSAAAALGTVGDERSAPTLLRLVQHDCVEVAEVAARALSAVAPALVEHLAEAADANPQLRHAASVVQAGLA